MSALLPFLELLFPSLVGFVNGSSRTELIPNALIPRSISSFFNSLCREMISPPTLQLSTCSIVASLPQPSHFLGIVLGRMLYLMQALSRHSSLPSSVPARVFGTAESHAPVSDALSTIFLLLGGSFCRLSWSFR